MTFIKIFASIEVLFLLLSGCTAINSSYQENLKSNEVTVKKTEKESQDVWTFFAH